MIYFPLNLKYMILSERRGDWFEYNIGEPEREDSFFVNTTDPADIQRNPYLILAFENLRQYREFIKHILTLRREIDTARGYRKDGYEHPILELEDWGKLLREAFLTYKRILNLDITICRAFKEIHYIEISKTYTYICSNSGVRRNLTGPVGRYKLRFVPTDWREYEKFMSIIHPEKDMYSYHYLGEDYYEQKSSK